MTTDKSDEDLMKEYATLGSGTAFSALYQRYESKLYGFFIRRLAADRKSIASDLFQKTWLKVHKARHQFDDTHKFASWLFSIAINTLRDEWRLPRLVEHFEDISKAESIPTSGDIEQDIDIKLNLARLEYALLELPEHYREILLLSEWEGFTGHELAKVLGITEVSARKMVSRAKLKVKQIMMKDQ